MTEERLKSETMEDEVVHQRPLSLRLVARIFSSLGHRAWMVGVSSVLMFICVMTDMMLVRQIRQLVDRTDLLTAPLLALLGPLVIIAVINRLTGMGQWLLVSYATNKAVCTLRARFFAKLQTLSKHFFDTHKTGWLVARSTGDMGLLMEFMRHALIMGVMIAVSTLFALREIADIAVILLLPTLVLAPVLMIATHLYRTRMSQAQRDARRQNSRLVANLTENIRGVRVVQAFSREERNLRKFNRLNLINHNLEIRIARLNALFLPSVDLVGIVNTVVVVLFGSWLMNSELGARLVPDPLTAGDLVAYILYSNIILWPLRMAVELYSMSLRAMAGAERIFDILDREPEVQNPPAPVRANGLEGDVRFENVQFRYNENAPLVLQDFSLHIEPGRSVALVGETGAGKTTVANLLGRFYDVSAGQLLLDGRDIREYSMESLHQQMGIVLQHGFLFSGTVLENLRFRRPDLSEEEIVAAAKQLGTHDSIMRLADGYHTQVLEGGESISEGQRQLVSITRTLIADPKILLLDEPTSSLDVYTEKVLYRALERLLHGRTTVMIAHRLSTVRNTDRIIVLDHGNIVEEGPHDALVAQAGRYAKMVRISRESEGK